MEHRAQQFGQRADQIRHALRGRAIPLVARRSLRNPEGTTHLGSEYGGWNIPLGLIGPNSVVYSFGVGEDITFDLALIEQTGCVVEAFDPTPRAIAHVVDAPSQFRMHEYGLWTSDGDIQLWLPANSDNVSLSVIDRRHTNRSLTLPVRSLESIMNELGHDHIDLFKADIEGAEAAVLDDLIMSDIRPRILAVEVELPEPITKTARRISRLRSLGYSVIHAQRRNIVLLWNRNVP